VLTHFCDRGRRSNDRVPVAIRNMTGSERLASILWEGRLLAFQTFSQGDPAACFTESTAAGLAFVLHNRPYRPWGLIVDRDSVYNAGGGPVWYARPAEHRRLQELNPRLRQWAVRLDAGSDWLEEREWRIAVDPANGSPSMVSLSNLKLVALLVGDPHWAPRRGHSLPPAASGVLRFWWDSSSARLQALPPWS
jgi:hypothetical protein